MAKAKDENQAVAQAAAPVENHLREMAREIFIRMILANGSHGKTVQHVAEQAFELAAAFEEVAAVK